MKQTAVEWLFEQISTSKHFYNLMEDINSRSTVAQSNIFEQAKEMEKEQIMDAAKIMLEGKVILFNSTEIGDRRAEQYYNKQFKQQ